MRHVLLSAALGLVLLPTLRAAATEPSAVQPLLEREIIGNVLPAAELERFCDKRVATMGNFTSAEQWQAEADRLRKAVLEKVVFRGEAARWREAPLRVEWLDTIAGGPGYRIKKFRFEALPGLWIPCLLYEPEKLSGKVPVILNVNGHFGEGKSYRHKQLRAINQAKRGMLALNIEWIGMGQLQGPGYPHGLMNQLDLCGTSGLAPFYLNMSRALDAALSLPNADPERVAVTGLSGGGWQSIFFSALDTRVKLGVPVAGYASYRTRAYEFADLGDSEQTPTDLAALADFTHLTAMRAPRPTLLIFNSKDDCCFASGRALPPLLDAAQPIFKLLGHEDALRWHINDDPGTHNYDVDNRQALYRMIGDFFYPGDTSYNASEIPTEAELKTSEELTVPLPKENESFNTLARKLAQTLPRQPELPSDVSATAAWQAAGRAKLREIVRAQDYEVQAIDDGSQSSGGLKATFWRLQMGGSWTVPAVELTPAQPKATAILVADEGRKTAAKEAARLVDAGYRVLAVDPFYFGESTLPKLDYLYALLLAGVGHRPLGIQASQVAAIARWAQSTSPTPLTVVALGPRSSSYALVAAALEPKAIASLELHDPLGSLKEIIEENRAIFDKPELFCFGLLEAFDVRQLAALTAPRSIKLVHPSQRAKTELSSLAPWWEARGGKLEIAD